MENKQLEDRFNTALEKWSEHCKRNSHFSFDWPYLDCDAYREIVSMGSEILPLIRENYANEKGECGEPGALWVHAIREIIGKDFEIRISDNDIGNIKKLKQSTLNWLDKNMSKYLQRITHN